MAKGDKPTSRSKRGTSLLEWVSALIGALLTIAILAFISREALDRSAAAPPLLEVQPLSIVQSGDFHMVEVRISNLSGRTAASVDILGELKTGEQVVEESTVTVTYVPGHSERKAGLIFTRDPRKFQLQARATGYEEP